MGYGATPNGKRTLFAASRMQVRPRDVDPDEGMAHTYRVATIDLAAMFRKLVPFELGADTPPFKAVQSIFMPAIHQFPDLKTIIFCFDSPHLVPEMRKTFHVERRYSKAAKPPGHNELRCPDDGRNYHKDKYPVSPADIDGLTIHSMPKWWPCFWNSAKGKFAIWEKVEESIREYLLTGRGKRGVQYIIDGQDGRRWFYPAPVKPIMMPPTNYGEGDLKCIMWATHFSDFASAPVLIMTIDWDVILALILYMINAHVWIGTVYIHEEHHAAIQWYCKDSVKLTRRGGINLWGESKTKQMLEIIEIPHLIRSYPTRLGRQQMLMLALCSGGVDYCYGLKKFGFDESKLIPLTLKLRDEGFPKKWLVNVYDPGDPYRRYLKFYPGIFIMVIESIWVSLKSKHLPAADLNKELLNILFCITYFGGFDSQRPTAGPPPPDYEKINLFPGMDTVKDIIDAVRELAELPTDEEGEERKSLIALFPPVVITEEYAATASSLPHTSDVSYYGGQHEAIQALAQ